MSLFLPGVTLGQGTHVARCCGVCRAPLERLPRNLHRPALFTSGATPERAILQVRFPSSQSPSTLRATPWHASSVCNGSDSLHTGAVPKTAHNKLLTPKKTELGTSLALIWCSSASFVLLSLPRCSLQVCCLVPVRSCALYPASDFSLPPWRLSGGALCFVSGRATTLEPTTLCNSPLRKLLLWYHAGWQDTQYWNGVGHRAVRSVACT